MLTASSIERDYLSNSLDAIAANDEQARLIFNPSPEVDSLVEDFKLLIGSSRRSVDRQADAPLPARLADTSRRLRALAHSNGRERRFELAISAAADRDVRSARDLALNGRAGGEAVLACKAIARAVRVPLKTIADPPAGDGMALVDAVRAVDQVLARAPAAQVCSPTVRHEIGDARYRLLCDLVERRGPATNDAGEAGGLPASKTLGSGEDHAGL